MEPDVLKTLLKTGETETIEFKENIGDSMFRAISAFSNKRGGMILLGIDKDGKTKGVDPSGRYLEELSNRIIDKTSIYPSIEVVDADGKRIVIVDVPPSAYPVSYERKYYERVGNTTREMSSGRLKALLLREKPWDIVPSTLSIEDIDLEVVKTFQRRAKESGRLPGLSSGDSPETLLEKMEAVVDHHPVNGALMLFGKDPQRHFINASIRIGRFKTDTDIIDDKWVGGNLFNQFDEALKQLMQHISVRYEIKGVERKDIWDYPLPVLREALLNALVHRDYHDIANFVQIKIYDDRIWISNPGALPEGLTIDELRRPHKSHIRNPLIARAFYLAGLIEQFGSGTMRMISGMKESGLREPEFREEMGGFSVYLFKSRTTKESLLAAGLNERQARAVLFAQANSKITNADYRRLTGIGRVTAFKELDDIVKKGHLVRVGTTGQATCYTRPGNDPNARNAHQTLTERSQPSGAGRVRRRKTPK